MDPRLSVSAICSNRWSLDGDLRWWATAGIDQVGIALRKLEPAGLAAGARRVADAGLRVTNALAMCPFPLARPAEWPEVQDRLLASVDAAAAMGAECLVVTTGPAGPLPWDEAAGAWADAAGPGLSAARAAGVPLAVEHTNSLRADISILLTLRDAVDLARRLDVGVCLEVNACWSERGVEATIAEGIDRVRLVQVSDFVLGTWCTPDRAVPGDGDIPMARLLGAIRAAGYPGVFDLELIGPRIDAEGPESAVARGLAHLTAVLDGT